MISSIANKTTLSALGIASVLAVCGQASASGPRVGVGIGISNRGSSVAVSIGGGHGGFVSGGSSFHYASGYHAGYYGGYHGGYYGGRYYGGTRVFIGGSFCWPSYYPYYSSYPTYGYDYSYPVTYAQPVVIQQQPVVVQSPPTIVQAPAPVQQPQAGDYQASAAQPAQPQAGTYRDRELGDAYMRMNDPDNAIRAYARYLGAWSGDGTAMRNYGFALIEHGDVQEGFKSVAKGYQLEPDMVKRPLRKQDFGGDLGFQKVLDGAARAADSTNTADGWLTVAILQHAAGKDDVATTALQRARDAGLDHKTLDQFTLEIGKPK